MNNFIEVKGSVVNLDLVNKVQFKREGQQKIIITFDSCDLMNIPLENEEVAFRTWGAIRKKLKHRTGFIDLGDYFISKESIKAFYQGEDNQLIIMQGMTGSSLTLDGDQDQLMGKLRGLFY